MDYYKKRKIKDTLLKYRPAIIGTGAFILIGGIALIVGFAMSGWSIVKWFEKGYGTTFFILLIFLLIGLGVIWYVYLMKGKKGR